MTPVYCLLLNNVTFLKYSVHTTKVDNTALFTMVHAILF